MDVHLAGSRPTRRAPAEYFTGTVLQDPIIATESPARLVSTRVSFEPGARTAWHYASAGPDALCHLRGRARAGRRRTDPRNPPGRRGLDSTGRKALARRVADQRHDPHRHAGSARRQLRDLDGKGHGRGVIPQKSASYIRCAVQVPEHKAARHVPDPDVPVSAPEPTARFMPLASVTRMAPASATRPDAVTAVLFEAT